MTTIPVRGTRAGTALGLYCFLRATISILGAVGALRAQEQINGVIAGRVTNSRGQPQHLLVQLSSPGDILVGDVFTDSNGDFAFSDLRSGIYYVTVEAEGYQPAHETVGIDARSSSRTGIMISLEPAAKERSSPGQIIAGSRNSYALNIKDKSRPFDAKALREFDKGTQKQRAENFQSAVAHYQKALKIEPDFYPALNNLGAIYLRQKNLAQAESAFLKSLETHPEDSEAYVNLGHVSYEQAKYPQAIERLEEGLKRSPRSSVGHFFLGSAYLKVGDLAKAEENLKAACTLDPAGMASAHLQLANLYLKRHDLGAAGVQLQNYLKSNPSDPQGPAIKKMLDSITAQPTN
jgi:Flp pilus assembly protein TadD